MWSLFKTKKPDLLSEARRTVTELRSKFSDDVLAKGMSLNDRVNRLRSVNLEYINELMGLTDDTADLIFPLYESFPAVSALEIHGFCASTLAAAVHVSELPADEKPTVIDIYLDLWVDSTVQQAPKLNGKILKGSIDRMWRGLLPGLLRAASDQEAIKLGFANPPLALSQELDGLLGVARNQDDQAVAGGVMKAAIVNAIIAVREL